MFKLIDENVLFYSYNLDLLPPKPKLSFRYLKQGIQEFHRKYIMAPASCLTVVKKHSIRYYDTVYKRDRINYFWSIKNPMKKR